MIAGEGPVPIGRRLEKSSGTSTPFVAADGQGSDDGGMQETLEGCMSSHSRAEGRMQYVSLPIRLV